MDGACSTNGEKRNARAMENTRKTKTYVAGWILEK
jgi:hypothetical protein